MEQLFVAILTNDWAHYEPLREVYKELISRGYLTETYRQAYSREGFEHNFYINKDFIINGHTFDKGFSITSTDIEEHYFVRRRTI